MSADSQRPSSHRPPSIRPAPPLRFGEYELGERLGAGGMAEVFEAHRTGPHGFRKRVALKRILPRVLAEDSVARMFIEEAKLVAQLDHPHIVQLFDFGEVAGELFIAMELVQGASLGRLMRVIAARGEQFPLDVALHVTAQTALALSHAHRMRDTDGCRVGLVHRDVSPGNILLTQTGHTKLADFGIACTGESERHTGDNHMRGKMGYMSPEQVTGATLDDRSDVFTLGVVLTELLIGERLFHAKADLDTLLKIRDVDLGVLKRTRRRIPADVRRLVMQVLSPVPHHRPTARELSQALQEMLRRRGYVQDASESLARLMARHELIDVHDDEDEATDAGARPTAMISLEATPVAPRLVQPGAGAELPSQYFVEQGAYLPGGPVAFPELVRLATTGALTGRTLVRRNGDGSVPACELSELSRIFSTPALQWEHAEISRPRFQGRLAAANLLPMVHRLAANRETGMLYMEEGGRRKKVYFVGGRPDFVASNDRNELLGEFLVERGYCLPMELEMGLAVLPQHGGRLGDALVAIGVLRPVELYRAVTEQVRARYLDTFRWRTGEWRYVRGAASQEETYPIEQDAQVLMRDAAAQLDPSELEAALTPAWERVLRPVEAPPASLDTYQMPEGWRWVIQQAQGNDTVGSLFGRCTMQSGLDAEDALRALFLGMSCQLLEAAG